MKNVISVQLKKEETILKIAETAEQNRKNTNKSNRKSTKK